MPLPFVFFLLKSVSKASYETQPKIFRPTTALIKMSGKQKRKSQFLDRRTVAFPSYGTHSVIEASAVLGQDDNNASGEGHVADKRICLCTLAQSPTASNPSASFQLPRYNMGMPLCSLQGWRCFLTCIPQNKNRGTYCRLSWEERIQADSRRRKLLPVRSYVEQGVAKCLEEHLVDGKTPSQNMSRETMRWNDQVTRNKVGRVDMKRARDAKTSFRIGKTCMTRSILMGLLKTGTVVRALSVQPFKDGTVFEVLDLRKMCAVLMRGYQLVSTEEARIQHDANEVMKFLDRCLIL